MWFHRCKHSWKLSHILHKNIQWCHTYKCRNAFSLNSTNMWTWYHMNCKHVDMLCSLWHVQMWSHQLFAGMLPASILLWQLGCIYPCCVYIILSYFRWFDHEQLLNDTLWGIKKKLNPAQTLSFSVCVLCKCQKLHSWFCLHSSGSIQFTFVFFLQYNP